MNTKKLSINKLCIMSVLLFGIISVAMLTILYLLTGNIAVVACGVLYAALVLLGIISFIVLIRRKLVLFSDTFCRLLDDMLFGEMEPPQAAEEEIVSKPAIVLADDNEIIELTRKNPIKSQCH